jgi:hypothetical protein
VDLDFIDRPIPVGYENPIKSADSRGGTLRASADNRRGEEKMRTRVSLLLFLVSGSLAVAQDAAIRPRPSPRPKPQEGGAYHSQFQASVEGDYFAEFQGEYDEETIIRPRPGTPRPPIYNRSEERLIPPPTPGAPLPEMIVPWHDILASGPEDPSLPLPYLDSLPNDFVLDSATFVTANGSSVPMQIQAINDLTLLPTSADRGQGTWQIDWGDLSADFLSMGGRYYLLTADIPLGDFVPEPSTALTALAAAACLVRARRRL